MLPAIALLAGAAVGTVRKLWPRASWLTYGVLCRGVGVFGCAATGVSVSNEPIGDYTSYVWSKAPFRKPYKSANYIRTHSGKDSRIAVLGSEPEIPFYAHRHSATGHIYMYGLMEPQPYALTMQKELIRDVETAQPDYVVFVTNPTSWLRRDTSPRKLFDWWAAYQPQRVQTDSRSGRHHCSRSHRIPVG